MCFKTLRCLFLAAVLMPLGVLGQTNDASEVIIESDIVLDTDGSGEPVGPTIIPEPVPEAESERAQVGSTPVLLSGYNLPGLRNKVSLTSLEPWDVVQLIEFLAYKGGLNNIVVGPGVAGLTTKLKFQDVTVGDALEVVLSVNHLAYEIKGGIIMIMADEEYQKRYGASFYDNKRVRLVNLKYADPDNVAGMIEAVKSQIGTVVSDPVTGTLILIDTPAKIEEMMAVVTRADISTIERVVPTETRTFVLQYADVATIEEQIMPILTEDMGSIRSDERTKSIIVEDLPHKMDKIGKLVIAFDRQPKEVFIEAKMVQVSLNDQFRLGIDWNHLFQGINPRFSLGTSIQPQIVGSRGEISPIGTGAGVLTYNTIVSGGDLNVILDALEAVGETKILSNPHVAVLDGEDASIKVIREEPYAEAQLESGSTNVVGETIKFVEVGVKLEVTPRINDSGHISMAIKPEVSTIEGNYQARFSIPIVQRSYAETSVMVKDGQTIIIAGMIQNTKGEQDTRIPVLGRIPLLGTLFRSHTDLVQASELIVFLTPRIVSGDEPHLLLRDMEKAPKPLRAVGEEAATK